MCGNETQNLVLPLCASQGEQYPGHIATYRMVLGYRQPKNNVLEASGIFIAFALLTNITLSYC